MRHFLDRTPFDGSHSPCAGAGVARPLSVSEQLRGVFPDQDRVKKTVEDAIKVGNDLLAVMEFCRSGNSTRRRWLLWRSGGDGPAVPDAHGLVRASGGGQEPTVGA